jgi:hypothetical protein
MRAWACGVTVMIGVGALWVLSGTQHSRSVLAGATDSIRALEAEVAAHPDNPAMTRTLAQAYLDARQPGLARVLLEAAPGGVRTDLRTRHVLARTLLDLGRTDLALAVDTGVVAACRPSESGGLAPSCDPVLFASAVRRASILREMVALGVTDALAHPEASLVAYENATREARVRLE